mgnify:CR=1 FL=1
MAVRLSEFRNEPYADFSKPGNARAMRAALAQAVALALNQSASLTLTGSDPENDPLTFAWFEFDPATSFAAGVRATNRFPVTPARASAGCCRCCVAIA